MVGGDDDGRPAADGSGSAEVAGPDAAGGVLSGAELSGVVGGSVAAGDPSGAGVPGSVLPVLIIGIGSPLRRDDAVGHAVIDALTARDIADTDLLSVHQLTPEVAAEFRGRRLVVFVDAAVDTDEVTVTRLATDASGRLLTHHMGAAGLLGMAGGLGWSPEAAALVSIPATDLGLGTGLSPAAEARVGVAVDAVLDLLA